MTCETSGRLTLELFPLHASPVMGVNEVSVGGQRVSRVVVGAHTCQVALRYSLTG